MYTDKEMNFDVDKDRMQYMRTKDGGFHVWHWGTGRVLMETYNAKLQHQSKKVISNHSSNIVFVPFKDFYYTLIIEAKKSKIYKVWGDSLIDKTADFNRIQLLPAYSLYLQPADNSLFLIQYHLIDSTDQSDIYITNVDSSLNYTNAITIRTNYNAQQLRTLKVFVHDDQLLLVNTKVYEDFSKLIVHKVRMDSGTVVSNTYQFDNKLFTASELQRFGNNFLLQGQVSEPLNTRRKQASYTYLMTLDDSLQAIDHYNTGLPDSTTINNSLYFYYPVSTTILPNYQLLTIDYCRVLNAKTRNFNTQLRYHQLDASLRNFNTISFPTADYSNFPGYLFNKPGEMNIYYEEQIRENTFVVHSCQLNNTIDNDRLLQLRPKNRYMLRRAISVGDNHFVMPYTHNYKLGLVRVTVKTED